VITAWYVEKGKHPEIDSAQWYVQDAPGQHGRIYATCSSRLVALAVRRGFIEIGFLPTRDMNGSRPIDRDRRRADEWYDEWWQKSEHTKLAEAFAVARRQGVAAALAAVRDTLDRHWAPGASLSKLVDEAERALAATKEGT
jgi:hypothetical protein